MLGALVILGMLFHYLPDLLVKFDEDQLRKRLYYSKVYLNNTNKTFTWLCPRTTQVFSECRNLDFAADTQILSSSLMLRVVYRKSEWLFVKIISLESRTVIFLPLHPADVLLLAVADVCDVVTCFVRIMSPMFGNIERPASNVYEILQVNKIEGISHLKVVKIQIIYQSHQLAKIR